MALYEISPSIMKGFIQKTTMSASFQKQGSEPYTKSKMNLIANIYANFVEIFVPSSPPVGVLINLKDMDELISQNFSRVESLIETILKKKSEQDAKQANVKFYQNFFEKYTSREVSKSFAILEKNCPSSLNSSSSELANHLKEYCEGKKDQIS